MLAGAAQYSGPNSRFALARLTSDGSLDPTFGDGTVTTNVTPSYDWANGMALQPDGNIIVVGSLSAGSDNGKIGVLRYRSDGSLDSAFGGDGIVVNDPTPTFDDGLAIGVEADGQIIVAGGAGLRRAERAVRGIGVRARRLARSDVRRRQGLHGPHPEGRRSLRTRDRDDGKIVVAGNGAAGSADPKFALVRYERDGSFDLSLDGDGIVITNFTRYEDGAYSVAIDPDGRIVSAGLAGNGGPAPRLAAARYLADGTLDPTFGGDGKVSTDLTSHFDSAWGVAVQADGSVVCPGVAGAGGSHASFAVLRYQP